MAVTITVNDLEEIKSALGFPIEDELDWVDAGGTNEYITKYVVPRVLRTYFTYFPLKFDFVQSIESTFEIPYPSITDGSGRIVWGMLRYYFNYKKEFIGSLANPFVLQQNVISIGGNGNLGFGGVAEYFDRIATAESIIGPTMALRVEDYQEEQVIKGSTNVQGNLSIQFACYTEDFNKIRYNHKDDALKLAKAYLLHDTTMLREQLKIAGKIEVNSSVLTARGDAWETEVLERWKNAGRAIVVK